MGHRKLDTAILIAGFVTLGAVFGKAKQADASVIVVPEEYIVADSSASAYIPGVCEDLQIDSNGLAFCWDTATYLDVDHYSVDEECEGEE